ncbi:hypothetical protein [Halioxenophilus aromaticivorans]|uniref:Tetratricopeptide repeat protein n=1 Tax=Halioxenophilus aromaticivorans TaxID=1306992 RepID=A0AAV3U671_9ALTE
MENQKPNTPPPWAQAPIESTPATPWWRNPKTALPLAGLLVLLLAVVFWLPNQVTVPASTANNSSTASTAVAKKLEESPWTDAQLAKQRRDAQDILARLLDKQQSLESAAVNLWAAEAFASAMATATEGDDLYRQRDFEPAKQRYLAAERAMDELLAQVDQQFAQRLAAGETALAGNDAKAAVEALSAAAAIDPSDAEAAQLLARAEVLGDILTLVKESDQALLLNDITTAEAKLNQARALDDQSDYVASKQAQLQATQKETSFASRMSKGYTALQAKQFTDAITAFESALALNPGAEDAQAALRQARNGASQHTINNAIASARAAVQAEDWTQAVAHYDQALKQDPTLVSAKVDRIKAEARRQLDDNLGKLLADPLRLSDDAVYRAAQKDLADAQSLATPGSRMAKQVDQLRSAMKTAQTPVQVTLTSDNQTKVTLYRIGQLGEFEQQSLNLKPGQYVLVGSRAGFRDVRKEFTVQANQQQTIDIQCTEPVANG